MKYLVYFLFFSTACFSQNYYYAVDESSKTFGVNNQLEEIDYFNAYLLPITQKATLQQALDKYGSVRLEKGDYTGVNIVMKSNQRLYGHPSLTKISNISIPAGTTNVYLVDLFPADSFITLGAGDPISNCIFKSVKWATLRGTNIMLENCLFINFGGPIRLDCSQSGYLRNNKIIKHQSGTVSNLLIMKGNSSTPSYGNVHLHTNFLTPHGDTTDLSQLDSATFVGIDGESWNYTGEGSKALIYARNINNFKITDFGGGNNGNYKTPAYDIDAAEMFFLSKYISYPSDILSLRANMFLINGNGSYIRQSGTVTGYELLANLEYSNAIKYNGVEVVSTITDAATVSKITKSILGTKNTPWARPNWETLPDPLGPNWKTDRTGKPDQTSYIQNLIDTKKLAELPEGVYYIKSTLKVPLDNAHGIVGKGTGKTVICGLTDDFPLISLAGGADGNFILANITLQGGSVGVYASTDYGSQNLAYQNMKFVVFRNQKYGIHLNRTGGFDNNFLENLGFVNCEIGFYQEPTPGNSGEGNSAYVDKTMFYKNQFINCATGLSMLATRADNLNAWVDCNFNGGKIAINMTSQNNPVIANSDFTNYTGVNIIKSNTISMYNVNVFNNKITGSTIVSAITNIEGSKFSDSSPMFSPMLYTTLNHHIVNSEITGNVLANPPANQGYGKESAVFCNSKLLGNSTLNKLLVNVKEGVSLIVINSTPDPYPQMLVTY